MTGGQMQIEATHFRKVELEQIAQDVGAEVVYMEPVPEDEKHKFGHEHIFSYCTYCRDIHHRTRARS